MAGRIVLATVTFFLSGREHVLELRGRARVWPWRRGSSGEFSRFGSGRTAAGWVCQGRYFPS
jgi:hypothetical protein